MIKDINIEQARFFVSKINLEAIEKYHNSLYSDIAEIMYMTENFSNKDKFAVFKDELLEAFNKIYKLPNKKGVAYIYHSNLHQAYKTGTISLPKAAKVVYPSKPKIRVRKRSLVPTYDSNGGVTYAVVEDEERQKEENIERERKIKIQAQRLRLLKLKYKYQKQTA